MPGYIHELKNVNNIEIYNFKFDFDKLTLLDRDIERLTGFKTLFLFHPLDKYVREYNSYMSLSEENLNYAKYLCNMIFSEFNDRKDGYKWVVKSYFIALITFLSRNFSPYTESSFIYAEEIVWTASYIHENLNKKITLSQLSSMACLSERQYSRVFKKMYGLSPIDYVINCRLNLACNMMKNTTMSLQQIYTACGFKDKVSFSRLFKSHFDIPPGEYRKRLN